MAVSRKQAACSTGVAICAAWAVAAWPQPAQAGFTDWLSGLFGGSQPAPVQRQEEDDEKPPPELFPEAAQIGFAEASVAVDETAGKIELMLVRSVSFGDRVSARWETRAGSAEAGKDFGAASGEVTFEPKEREKRIVIPILDDQAHDPDETFEVVVVSVRNGDTAKGRERVVVTIRDNDPKPIQVNPGELSAERIVSFGSLEIGREIERPVALRNNGSAPVRVTKVEVSGSVFALGSEACTKAPLAPGGSCQVMATFAPGGAGPLSGKLLVGWETEGKGSSLLEVGLAGSGVDPTPPVDPMAERIRALKEARRKHGGGQSFVPPPRAQSADPEYRLEDEDWKNVKIDPSYFTFPIKPEIADRVMTTDRYIGCVLETAINSQLPGPVICQVEQPVFGVGPNRLVLIEPGTRVEGKYQPLAKTGDTRLNVHWTTFRRPDNSRIKVDSGFQSLDVMGRTGLPGDVDNRFWEKYGSALFMTGLAALSGFAVPATNDRLAAAQETGAEGMLKITQQVLEENVDLRPVTSIPAGSRLIIKPEVDLWLPVAEVITPTNPAEAKAVMQRAATSQTAGAAKPGGAQAGKAPVATDKGKAK